MTRSWTRRAAGDDPRRDRRPQGRGGGGDVGSAPARSTGIRATGDATVEWSRGFLRAENNHLESPPCPSSRPVPVALPRRERAVLPRSATDRPLIERTPTSSSRTSRRSGTGTATRDASCPRAVDVLPRGTGVWMALVGGRDRGEASFREGPTRRVRRPGPGGRGGRITNRTARDPEGVSSSGTTSAGGSDLFPSVSFSRPGAALLLLSEEERRYLRWSASARLSRPASVLRKCRLGSARTVGSVDVAGGGAHASLTRGGVAGSGLGRTPQGGREVRMLHEQLSRGGGTEHAHDNQLYCREVSNSSHRIWAGRYPGVC